MATIQWFWIGAVSSDKATIKGKVSDSSSDVRILYDTTPTLAAPRVSSPVAVDSSTGLVATFTLDDLQEDREYHYTLEADGNRYPEVCSFKTLKVGKPYDFAVGFGSCAGGGRPKQVSNSEIFDRIREYSFPALSMFIHTGDLHYRNIDVPDVTGIDEYRNAYDDVLSQPRQRQLFQNIPIAYVWDDHDYGPNNSDGTYPGKTAARAAYREQVPHYPLGDNASDGAIYQSFVVGRVRFVMTDNRSCRSPHTDPDDSAKTVLGDAQKGWFFRELERGRDEEKVIVWVNTFPWIGDSGDDGWHKYTTERREIASFIKDKAIDRILMISGDAHMIAMDDGTNNKYAEGGGGSFPVVHAGALDSTPSSKGGPYSEGMRAGTSQWGVLKFTDSGSAIHIEIKLKNEGNTKIRRFGTTRLTIASERTE